MRRYLSKIEVFGMRVISAPNEESAKRGVMAESPSLQKMTPLERKLQIKEKKGPSPLDLNRKSEVLGTEYYSEKELLQLKEMLKNSDI